MPTRRLAALLALALAVPLAGGVATTVAPASAQPAAAATSAAQAGPRYHAVIRRTAHGIPHITAANFGDLGFGSGYAQAGTNLCTLADTVVTARGERSRWFGPKGRYNDQVTLDASNLQVDAFVTDLHRRHVVEKLLADKQHGPGPQARAMVRGYVAGINQWIRQHGADGVT